MKEKLKIEVELELDFPDFDELVLWGNFGGTFCADNFSWSICRNNYDFDCIDIEVCHQDCWYYSERESFEYSEENYEKAKGLIKTWIEELLKG